MAPGSGIFSIFSSSRGGLRAVTHLHRFQPRIAAYISFCIVAYYIWFSWLPSPASTPQHNVPAQSGLAVLQRRHTFLWSSIVMDHPRKLIFDLLFLSVVYFLKELSDARGCSSIVRIHEVNASEGSSFLVFTRIFSVLYRYVCSSSISCCLPSISARTSFGIFAFCCSASSAARYERMKLDWITGILPMSVIAHWQS